jgi:hypothetical protein
MSLEVIGYEIPTAEVFAPRASSRICRHYGDYPLRSTLVSMPSDSLADADANPSEG